MEVFTIEDLDKYIELLENAKQNLSASSGWFVSYTVKKNLHTHRGLCYLFWILYGSLFNYSKLERYIEEHAHLFGGRVRDGHLWWRAGRIKPRLQLIIFVLGKLRTQLAILKHEINL